MIEWKNDESKESKWNNKGIYAIIITFTLEYKIIQSYTTSKKAKDILKTMHEGTFIVKMSRIMKLNRDFMHNIIEEDETFDKFYAHKIKMLLVKEIILCSKLLREMVLVKKYYDCHINPDKEEMALLAKNFTRFFYNKKRSSNGVKRVQD